LEVARGRPRLACSTPEYEHVNGLTVGRGRFISQADLELDRNVAVIGADVADVPFPGQGPLGQKLRLRSSTFTVIGVVDRMGSILGLESRDSFVAVPLASFARVFGREHDMAIAVQAADPKEMAKAQDEVVAVLRRLRGVQQGQEDDFDIFSNESLTGTFSRRMGRRAFLSPLAMAPPPTLPSLSCGCTRSRWIHPSRLEPACSYPGPVRRYTRALPLPSSSSRRSH
jgi:hypothetical protein